MIYHNRTYYLIIQAVLMVNNVWLSSHLHWRKTQRAETITEQPDGSEGSSACCPTGSGSPPGATVLHRRGISYLATKKLVVLKTLRQINTKGLFLSRNILVTFYGWDEVSSVLSNVCRQDGEETLQVLIFPEVLWEHLSYYSLVVIVYLTLHLLWVCVHVLPSGAVSLLFSLQGIRQVYLIYLSQAHESVHVLRRRETKILLSPYTVFSLPPLEYWIEQGLFSGNLIKDILI